MIHPLPKPSLIFSHEWEYNNCAVMRLDVDKGDIALYFDEGEALEYISVNNDREFEPDSDDLYTFHFLVGYNTYSLKEIADEAERLISQYNEESRIDAAELNAHYDGLSNSDDYL